MSRSKAEAEALVRSRSGSLPGVILRPSIIVGDSRTGVTSSFKMMYWPLKIYARRLWRTVPGYPDAVLDIVPVDFVAAAVARLAFDEAALGTQSTCARGRGAAPPSSRLPSARRSTSTRPSRAMSIRSSSSRWSGRSCFCRCGDASAACCATARAYRDYFTMRMQFDTTNAERLLEPAGMRPPHVLDYLDRLFQLLRRQRLGTQAGSEHMNLFAAFQALARSHASPSPILWTSCCGGRRLRRLRRARAAPFDLAQLHADVCRIDAFLRRTVALRPGQPVAIYRTNDRQCFHWFLAIIRAGGIAVPLNPQLSLAEVRRILADSGTEILVTDKRRLRAQHRPTASALERADVDPSRR